MLFLACKVVVRILDLCCFIYFFGKKCKRLHSDDKRDFDGVKVRKTFPFIIFFYDVNDYTRTTKGILAVIRQKKFFLLFFEKCKRLH